MINLHLPETGDPDRAATRPSEPRIRDGAAAIALKNTAPLHNGHHDMTSQQIMRHFVLTATCNVATLLRNRLTEANAGNKLNIITTSLNSEVYGSACK